MKNLKEGIVLIIIGTVFVGVSLLYKSNLGILTSRDYEIVLELLINGGIIAFFAFGYWEMIEKYKRNKK